MFDGFFSGVASLLNIYYELVPSYAAAIAMLTLTIMAITTPLTLKQTRSMLQMQALQPEMKRIQQKYKDDRQKQNEEMMKFYQENGINPLGGCLPVLLQMPAFIILYQVVKGLTHKDSDGLFVPKYLGKGSQLFQDLHGSRQMKSIGIDLARGAQEVLGKDGFVDALPYLGLVAIVAVSAFYQQRQLTKRNPQMANNPAANVMKVMPLITVFIAYSFPAALVIYFVVSNLYRVGMQHYITHSMYSGEDSLAKKAHKAAAEAKALDGGTKGKAGGGAKATDTPEPRKGKETPKSPQNQHRASPNGSAKGAGSRSNRAKAKRKRR